MSSAWRRAAVPQSDWHTDDVWSRVAAQMSRTGPKGAANRRPGRWLKISAASAAAALVVATAAYELRARAPERDLLDRDHEYRTAAGQRAVLNLLDGTHVELGVESTLRVRMSASGPREVSLDGEAVFDVAHDAQQP